MRIGLRLATGLAFLAFAIWLAAENGRELVTLRLGFLTFRSVSLAVVVLGSIIAGMVIALLAGLRADLRNRELLRQLRAALGDEE
ncbi:MAG: lipopolysaccharide assembly protein LapA domain-containing protein [Gemmatimonadota bacterium]